MLNIAGFHYRCSLIEQYRSDCWAVVYWKFLVFRTFLFLLRKTSLAAMKLWAKIPSRRLDCNWLDDCPAFLRSKLSALRHLWLLFTCCNFGVTRSFLGGVAFAFSSSSVFGLIVSLGFRWGCGEGRGLLLLLFFDNHVFDSGFNFFGWFWFWSFFFQLCRQIFLLLPFLSIESWFLVVILYVRVDFLDTAIAFQFDSYIRGVPEE